MPRGINPQNVFKNLENITVQYGEPTLQEQQHPGIDIGAPTGTPVPSTTDGVVVNVENGHQQGENNFGNIASIRDAEGNTHQYAHLQQAIVRPGQQVKKGEQIATVGSTGAVYSKSGFGDPSSLDYRIVTRYQKYLNPMMFLKNL